jgi:ribosomal protein L11 methyltransferase
MKWSEISVMCPPASTEAISQALLGQGCGGVMMTGTDPVRVSGSFPNDEEFSAKLEFLTVHFDRLEEWGLPPLHGDITVRELDEEDWANAWKKYFTSVRPGSRVVIKPTWEEYDCQEGEVVLSLDPGMAFGTGGHPTTRLCLLTLEDLVKPGTTVADIGTGSGILAIAAALLGASSVLATDSDLLPRRVAQDNISHNGVDETVKVLHPDEFYPTVGTKDIVVMNIVANTILQLLPSAASIVKQGGWFIASGIVEDHRALMIEALTAAGFEDISIKEEDIWICLAARRNGNAPDTASLERLRATLPPLGGAWAQA